MKVRITFDLSKDDREAISHYFSYEKLATHEECKSYIYNEVMATLEDMSFDLGQYEKNQREKEAENVHR
tara:strand:- start:5 stop:211 length:207 start_codon:yes stop_codon:yes gene_type:complete